MKYSRLTMTLCLSAIFSLSLMQLPLTKAHAQDTDTSESAQGITSPTSLDADSNDTIGNIAPVVNGLNTFTETNGNKVSGLNAVFIDGVQLMYASSTNGIDWTKSPVPQKGRASRPTIAVVAGYIGIVYVDTVGTNGTLYYTYKKTLPGSPWVTRVINFGKGTNPALVSYAGKMHLTWAAGGNVYYTNFGPTGMSRLTTDQLVNPVFSTCGSGYTSALPSIAVIRQNPGPPQPLVLISYFYTLKGSCSSFGFYVSKGPTVGGATWPIIGNFVGTAALSTSSGTSMSIAANSYTGDFYVHVAARTNGVASTVLHHNNAWAPFIPWGTELILEHLSHVDVESTCKRFRIAVSDTQGTTDYAPVWYRTGTWLGSPPSPTWTDLLPVPVSSFARDPQALFVQKYIRPNTRFINAAYDERVGMAPTNFYFVGHNYSNVNGYLTPDDPCGTAHFDFNLSSTGTVGVFRPGNGTWYFDGGMAGISAIQLGMAGDQLAPGDYDGDGQYDAAVYRPSNGTWYILNSSSNTLTTQQFGAAGDIPTPDDFDGDGRMDLAFYRPSNSTWFINRSTDGLITIPFGASGDLPVAGDFDGDAFADLAIFRPATGTWFILRSSGGQTTVQFGSNGDKAVIGDYDGDGLTDVAVFRPSTGRWYTSLDPATNYGEVAWGQNGDVPVPADYDGDGRIDIAVYRPTNNNWYIRQSSDGVIRVEQFGASGDVPIPSAYVR